jgi:hypothetical protein
MERARLVSTANAYPTTLETLDITFNDKDGSAVTGSSWSTRNFTIAVSGTGETDGKVTATRSGTGGSNYVLTRMYASGKVTCTGDDTSKVCGSLGFDAE